MNDMNISALPQPESKEHSLFWQCSKIDEVRRDERIIIRKEVCIHAQVTACVEWFGGLSFPADHHLFRILQVASTWATPSFLVLGNTLLHSLRDVKCTLHIILNDSPDRQYSFLTCVAIRYYDINRETSASLITKTTHIFILAGF